MLGENACRLHLSRMAAASDVGRIAVNGDVSPHVIPVNFTVIDGGILIRLGTGWSAFHLDGCAVTFETDQAVASQHRGWSVVVEGVARLVPYDDVGRLGVNLPTPMVTVPGVRVFEIVPFKVTGRAVEPDLRSEQRDLPRDLSEVKGEQVSKLLLAPDSAAELASVLQSALWDLNTKMTSTDDPVLRETLLERGRLLEGLAAQLA